MVEVDIPHVFLSVEELAFRVSLGKSKFLDIVYQKAKTSAR